MPRLSKPPLRACGRGSRPRSADAPATSHHIRGCADFQALIPDYRAGSLPAARATLLKDHLNQCVVCRKIYEGKVVPMPAPAASRTRPRGTIFWATAAAVFVAAGTSVWFAVDQYGDSHGSRDRPDREWRACTKSRHAGIRPIAAGQDLPDGIELRTAANSSAMLLLRDGSVVEMRERSGVSTTQAAATSLFAWLAAV